MKIFENFKIYSYHECHYNKNGVFKNFIAPILRKFFFGCYNFYEEKINFFSVGANIFLTGSYRRSTPNKKSLLFSFLKKLFFYPFKNHFSINPNPKREKNPDVQINFVSVGANIFLTG